MGAVLIFERAGNEVHSDGVRFVQADIFDWTPDRAYDGVFFANWLSHVPPSRFEDFWALVAKCLKPDGRVVFIDEDGDLAAGRKVRELLVVTGFDPAQGKYQVTYV